MKTVTRCQRGSLGRVHVAFVGRIQLPDSSKGSLRTSAELDFVGSAGNVIGSVRPLYEDELIDAYVRDKLSGSEHAVEDQFLASPRRRARVEFARVFRDSSARTPQSRPKAAGH